MGTPTGYRNPVRPAAVVLAAGRSRRMGTNKLFLPWGKTTVLGQVLDTLERAGIERTVVVTREEIREACARLLAGRAGVVLHSFHPSKPEAMLVTLQEGLRQLLPSPAPAAFVVLADQPHLPPSIYLALARVWATQQAALIVPVHDGRRGHPWLLGRTLWPELLALPSSCTMRDFLHAHRGQTREVLVNTPAIHWDMDTPEEYRRLLAWWEAAYGQSH